MPQANGVVEQDEGYESAPVLQSVGLIRWPNKLDEGVLRAIEVDVVVIEVVRSMGAGVPHCCKSGWRCHRAGFLREGGGDDLGFVTQTRCNGGARVMSTISARSSKRHAIPQYRWLVVFC